MTLPFWIWLHADWPTFTWQEEPLAPLLRACALAQGRLVGMAGVVSNTDQARNTLDALLQNIITSSAI
ncbi:DUF4172 domain-containing protein, partial [Pseudomonas shirazensis]